MMMSLRPSQGVLTLRCEKRRNGPCFEPIHMRLTPVQVPRRPGSLERHRAWAADNGLPERETLEPIESCVVELAPEGGHDSASKALGALRKNGPMRYGAWQVASGLGKNTFDRARKELQQTGRVVKVGDLYRPSDNSSETHGPA